LPWRAGDDIAESPLPLEPEDDVASESATPEVAGA
jgi:hypothetical protein